MKDLVLHETPWFTISLSVPTVPTPIFPRGRLVHVDRLDMRLEDLKRYGGAPVRDIYNWLAPLPNSPGRYLTHDFGTIEANRIPEIGADNWTILPDDWWEYVIGIRDETVVKAPKYPRGGEPTQEQLDARTGHGTPTVTASSIPMPARPMAGRSTIECESYERRLQQVLLRPFQ